MPPFREFTDDTKYCSSIHCGSGYGPIDNADHVECYRNECEVEQCCNKVCSSYNCRGHYDLVDHADTVVCYDSGCSRSQCCKYNCKTNY